MSKIQMDILNKVKEGDMSVDEALELFKADDDVKAGDNVKAELANADKFSELKAPPFKDELFSSLDKLNGWQGVWKWIEALAKTFSAKETYKETEEWTVEAEGLKACLVKTINGNISIQGAEQSQIVIQATKVVQAKDEATAKEVADQAKITFDQIDESLHISCERPKLPPQVQFGVNYKITCPFEMALNLTSTNGTVKANDIKGDVEATTKNGKVALGNVAGKVQVKTVNGGVKANIVNAQDSISLTSKNGSIKANIAAGVVPITATTTNGSIKLAIPTDFAGQLEASTVNGRVRCELGMKVSHDSNTKLVAAIGTGGNTPLEVKTTNGSILIEGYGERSE